MIGLTEITSSSNNSQSQGYDLITFGDLCVDLIMTGNDCVPEFGQVEKLVDDYAIEMGGSCSIFACQAARLGLKVAILGRVGPDVFGELMIERMQQAGVDTRYVIVDPAYKTGLGIALCQGNDRAILTYLGSLNAIDLGDIPEGFISNARHLHHGSYFLHSRLRPHIPAIFHRARQAGLTISLDTNWDPEEKWGPELASLFPMVDLFFPNQQEALRITHSKDIQAAQEILSAAGVRLPVIKLGELGALLTDGQKPLHCQLDPALPGGDGIGAGDSFDAGFVTAWLRGLPLETCLLVASFCGQQVASAKGGLNGQPNWSQVEAFLKTTKG